MYPPRSLGRWVSPAVLVVIAGCSGVGLDEPATPPVPYVDLPGALGEMRHERVQGVMECLEEHGFSGTLLEDGTTSHHITPDQEDAFEQASVACRNEAFPDITEPPSVADLTILYQYQMSTRDCLADFGIAVSEPPTLEVFIESRDEERWSPYRESHRAIAVAGQREVEEACPDPQDYLAYWR